MGEHTPGPWSWDYCPKVYQGDAEEGRLEIADVDPHCDLFLKTAIANARLMAEAPDLLAACENLLREPTTTHRREARAVIAKAKGEA